MRRSLWAALILAASALSAGAQRVTLEVPLSPTLTISPSAVTISHSGPAPYALTAGVASFGAPSLTAGPVTFKTLPLPLQIKAAHSAPLAATPLRPAPVVPVPQAGLSSVVPAKARAKVVDSLREHGAEAGGLSGLDGETGKSALEANFLRAASLGDGGGRTGDGAPTEQKDPATLMTRLLERVHLDDRGKPEERAALEDSFRRLLATPTGRRYAEEFLAEGLTGVVHFQDFADSQLYLIDGRKKFFAAQAYTHWKPDGTVEIQLNRHFVDGDADIMKETLPYVLGHELLGHGLWYARAAKDNLYTAFHYHELNETMARLVGWSIDRELDGKFEEAGAWSYLDDPAYYLASLKMRLPYYAVTFSSDEMADPKRALNERLESAREVVDRAKRNLAAQATWTAVIEHFSTGHGIPESRFDLLRREQADQIAYYTAEVANAEAVVAEIEGLLGRMAAEKDDDSQKYLSAAAKAPLFERLNAEAVRLGAELKAAIPGMSVDPPRPAPLRPADQISWQELSKLYHDDVAADAKRKPGKKHWQ